MAVRNYFVLETVTILVLCVASNIFGTYQDLDVNEYSLTSKCRCERLGTVTNCSSLDLDEFRAPEVFCAQSFNKLDLSRNKISQFPEGVQAYRRVNISFNSIQRLQAKQVQKMETLDLSANRIRQIDFGDTFPSLRSLNISNNGIKGNKNLVTGSCNLVHIDLSGNNIESLDFITRCAQLSLVMAVGNSINKLPSDFSALKRLEYLDLNYNKLKSVSNFPTTLKVLHLKSNEITKLQDTSFKHLTSLKSLDLENNKITTIAEKTFEALVSLEELDLSVNKLTHISDATFRGLQSLMKLSVSTNDIASVTDDAFSDLDELRELILDENAITTLPALRLGQKVYRVSLLLNLIQTMDVKALKTILSGNEVPRVAILVLNTFRGDDPGWKEIVKDFNWHCSDRLIPLVEAFLEPNKLQSRYKSHKLPSKTCPCAFFGKKNATFGACINEVPTIDGVNWLEAAEDASSSLRDEL